MLSGPQSTLISNVVNSCLPVKAAISCKINQAEARKSTPNNAQVRDWWADCNAFGSPPEVKYLKPETISITSKAIKAIATDRPITLLKMASI